MSEADTKPRYMVFLRPPGEEDGDWFYEIGDLQENTYVANGGPFRSAEEAIAAASTYVAKQGLDSLPISEGDAEYTVFARDFAGLALEPPIPIEIDAISAWQVLSAIQLACRHPDFSGPARDTAEKLARGLQERIAITPALARVAEKGWHEEVME